MKWSLGQYGNEKADGTTWYLRDGDATLGSVLSNYAQDDNYRWKVASYYAEAKNGYFKMFEKKDYKNAKKEAMRWVEATAEKDK